MSDAPRETVNQACARRKMERARKAADALADRGLHLEAESVRALVRAYTGSVTLNQTLHRQLLDALAGRAGEAS